MNRLIIYFLLSVAFFTACKNDKEEEDTAPATNNYSIPSTYEFKDSDGNSTVSFSGQAQRLEMLSEMVTYLKTGNTKGTSIDAATLKSMYDNTYSNWNDSDNLGLVGSTKQLKNKTAGGDAAITSIFETYMDSVAIISAYNRDGSAGISGVFPNDGVSGPYLMNGKGQEYVQFIEKGLMNAVCYNQITAVYLGSSKMDVDNSSPVDTANGKYYTTMEHHWDEAFGYFTNAIDYPSNSDKRYWGKYANNVNGTLGSADNIATAFRKGRAAIANNDLTTRDNQITIIRDELEIVGAATAIHYLNSALDNMTNNTARNHVMSEAWAFIDGLRYGYNSIEGNSLTAAEIDQILSDLGDDFNTVTVSKINAAKDALANEFGLTDVKDQL